MLGNLMIAVMATGMAGGPSCANDFQSARMISVDPIELSSNSPDAGIGTIEVLASINRHGRIDQVTTLDPAASDHLQRAVEKASSRLQFEPAQACGEAVAQEVTFELPVLGTRFEHIDTDHTPGPDRLQHRLPPREGSRGGALGVHSSF